MQITELLNIADNEKKAKMLQEIFKNNSLQPDEPTAVGLRELVNSDDTAVRFWARKVYAALAKRCKTSSTGALSSHPEIVDNDSVSSELLFKKLQTAQSHFVAIEILQKIMLKQVENDLVLLLNYLATASDPIVISFITKNLGVHFPREDLIPALVPYLKNNDARIVANTIEGLEAINNPKCVVIFAQLLEHQNHRVRANAARALASARPDLARKILVKMLEKRELPHFFLAACSAICHMPSLDYLPYLAESLSDPLLIDGALKSVAAIGGVESLNYLEAVVEDLDTASQNKIKVVIKRIKNPEAKKNAQGPVPNPPSEPIRKPAKKGDMKPEFYRPQPAQVESIGISFKEQVIDFLQGIDWKKIYSAARYYLPEYLIIYLAICLLFLASAMFFHFLPFMLFKLLPMLGILILFLGTPVLFFAGIAGYFWPVKFGFSSPKEAFGCLCGSSFASFVILLWISIILRPHMPAEDNVTSTGSGPKASVSTKSWSGGFFSSSVLDRIKSGGDYTLLEVREECDMRLKEGDATCFDAFATAMNGKNVSWKGWVKNVQGDLSQQDYTVGVDIDAPGGGLSAAEISFSVNEQTASRLVVGTNIEFNGKINRAGTFLGTWDVGLTDVEIVSGFASSQVPGFKTLVEIAEEQKQMELEMQKQSEQKKKREEEIIQKLQHKNQYTYDEIAEILQDTSYPSERLIKFLNKITISGSGWVNDVSGGWFSPYKCQIDIDSPSAGKYHVFFEVSESVGKGLENGQRVTFSGLISGYSAGFMSGPVLELKRATVY